MTTFDWVVIAVVALSTPRKNAASVDRATTAITTQSNVVTPQVI